MNYAEARTALSDGATVRRAPWAQAGTCIVERVNYVTEPASRVMVAGVMLGDSFVPRVAPATPSIEDQAATDWELVS